MGTGLWSLHPFFICRNFEVLLFLNQSSMTRKHFEALASTLASVYNLQDWNTTDKQALLKDLVFWFSNFCYNQNPRFDRQRFEDRVKELIRTE